MLNLKRETIKKNIFLFLSLLSGFIFVAGVMCTVLGSNSPVKLIINGSPVKLIVPPALIFVLMFTLYKNSKKVLNENRK